MKVDGSFKSLLQGVSQQPARDRLPGQCEAQLNMSADPVDGLVRRAPTDLIKDLGAHEVILGWHDFTTTDNKSFILKLLEHDAKVYDLLGAEYPMTITDRAKAYLTNDASYAMATIENQTYISNKNRKLRMNPAKQKYINRGDGYRTMGIIQVLGGQYNRRYAISVDGVERAAFNTENGSEASHSWSVKTSEIAKQLEGQLRNWFTDAKGYTVHRKDDLIWIEEKTARNTPQWRLTASDDSGNNNMKAMTDQVPDTADLPRMAPEGYVARVATETDPEEDLWLVFHTEDTGTNPGSGFGQQGFWQETMAPGITYDADHDTWPIVLDYDEDTGIMKLDLGAWKGRQVGTTVTNPDPSFIGHPVRDISTFQSRLVFLAASSVIMSRTNRFADFWLGSVSTVADSDPIDISSTAVEASSMEAAVPHNRDLTIHSQNGQFIVFGRSNLTPANAALALTTAFEADLGARPVAAGRNIFFAHKYGRYAGIREFYTEGGSDINDTRPVTQHVKKYIVGNVQQLTTSSNHDILLVRTDKSLNKLYAYQFIWSDNEKVQSAWSTWELPSQILHTFFRNEIVYFVMQEDEQQYLVKMSLDNLDTDDVGYVVCMDNRVRHSDTHSQIKLLNPLQRQHPLIAVQGEGCPNPGMPVPVEGVFQIGDNWFAGLRYDMQGGDVVYGHPYMSEYEPTMPVIKDQDGVVINSAKLIIKHLIVSTHNTGYVSGQLMSRYGDGPVVTYEGRIVGDVNSIIGEQPISSDRFFMPVRQKTQYAQIRFFTDEPFPMTFLDIEWVGQYMKSGRRISIEGS